MMNKVLSKRMAGIWVLLGCALVRGEWELVWSDEFEGSGAPEAEKWDYDEGGGGWGNEEKQVYTDDLSNARVEGGVLKIVVEQDTEGTRTPTYTSARLVTRGKQAMQYGRVEVRAKIPSETGTWSAIWMLSEEAIYDGAYWPDNGEIDIMEHVGYEEDPLYIASQGGGPIPNIHSTLHTAERNHMDSQGIGASRYVADASEEFHTYVLEWDEETITTKVDGEEILHVRKGSDVGIPLRNPPEEIWPYWPFDQKFHLILNVAVGGTWGGAFRPEWNAASPYGSSGIDHDGQWPQVMEVDYVRMYQRSGEPGNEWNGFPLVSADWADSGDWMGLLYVAEEPYVYVAQLGTWAWLPESAPEGWIHLFHKNPKR